MVEGNEQNDIFHIRYPDSHQFTWRCKNPLKQKRPDYLLVSDSLQHEVETINISPSFQPDHSVLKIKLSHYKEGNRLHHTVSLTTPFFVTTQLLQQ